MPLVVLVMNMVENKGYGIFVPKVRIKSDACWCDKKSDILIALQWSDHKVEKMTE